MDFTTITLENRRQQVRLQAEVAYDPFRIFPSLQHIKDNNIFHVDKEKSFMILLVTKDH